MRTQAEHTPLPWRVGALPTRIEYAGKPGFRSDAFRVADAHFSNARLADTASHEEACANARLIALAANHHTALVELVQALLTYDRWSESGEIIKLTEADRLLDGQFRMAPVPAYRAEVEARAHALLAVILGGQP